MSKKLIPFSWLPFSWGMKGITRKLAQAEYELTGYELDRTLLDIRSEEFGSDTYNEKLNELDYRYNKIDESKYLRTSLSFIEDDIQRKKATLELDRKEGMISDTEYQKQISTINNEPWVTVISMDFGGKESLEGSFELDWNTLFVENLKKDGYVGPTDDSIVNQWFMTICKNVALEEFDGTGDFTADATANLETMRRWNSSESLDNNRKGYK